MKQYTIESGGGNLVIIDSLTGSIVARIPSATTITASTDCDDVLAECVQWIGRTTAVEHDCEAIHVTTE